jgi:acyl carrier protein
MDIKLWLTEQIAEESGLAIGEVSTSTDFEDFDLDSLSLVSLAYDLETLINKELSPTVFTEFNTIDKLAKWIEKQQ